MQRPALAIAVLLGLAAPALAQTLGNARACEQFALAEAKRDGGGLTSVRIVREEFPVVNRVEKRIGAVMIASEYLGRAAFTDGNGTRNSAFVCLLGGPKGLPLWFSEVPLGR